MKNIILFTLCLLLNCVAFASKRTIKQSGGDYTSLSAWEAGEQTNLVTASTIAVASIEGVWTSSDTTAFDIIGWTTGINNYILIYTSGQARHSGTWNGQAYRLVCTVNNGACLDSDEEYVTIDGLQVGLNGGMSGGYGIATGRNAVLSPTASITNISNNIVRNIVTINGYEYGILVDNGQYAKIWNNLVYDWDRTTLVGVGIYMSLQTGCSCYIYNNTVDNSETSFAIYSNATPSTILINNIGQRADNNDYVFNGDFIVSPECKYNISQDTSSPNVPYRSKSVGFVSMLGGNYLLVSTDTVAINQGINLSTNTAISFNTDALGTTRPQGSAWDIGYNEYIFPLDIRRKRKYYIIE